VIGFFVTFDGLILVIVIHRLHAELNIATARFRKPFRDIVIHIRRMGQALKGDIDFLFVLTREFQDPFLIDGEDIILEVDPAQFIPSFGQTQFIHHMLHASLADIFPFFFFRQFGVKTVEAECAAVRTAP